MSFPWCSVSTARDKNVKSHHRIRCTFRLMGLSRREICSVQAGNERVIRDKYGPRQLCYYFAQEPGQDKPRACDAAVIKLFLHNAAKRKPIYGLKSHAGLTEKTITSNLAKKVAVIKKVFILFNKVFLGKFNYFSTHDILI